MMHSINTEPEEQPTIKSVMGRDQEVDSSKAGGGDDVKVDSSEGQILSDREIEQSLDMSQIKPVETTDRETVHCNADEAKLQELMKKQRFVRS